MSQNQSFFKAVVVWGIAATATMTLSNQPQSLAQLPTTEGSATAPTQSSMQDSQGIFRLSEQTEDTTSLLFSPDGQTLVSGSYDSTIKLWNLKNRQLLHTLTGHEDAVRTLAVSPDGKILASGSDDLTIKLWDLKTQKLLHTLRGHSQKIHSLIISPDGQTLVSASSDRTIKLWNLETGQLLRTLTGHSGSVCTVLISPDGKTLVSTVDRTQANTDNAIMVWNLKTGKLLHRLSGHSEDVAAVFISPDGQTLVSTGWSENTSSPENTHWTKNEIKLWNLKTGELLSTLHTSSPWRGLAVISPDGRFLATAGIDYSLELWSLRTGELLRSMRTGLVESGLEMHAGRIYTSSLVFSPDSKTLAEGDGGIYGLFTLGITIYPVEMP